MTVYSHSIEWVVRATTRSALLACVVTVDYPTTRRAILSHRIVPIKRICTSVCSSMLISKRIRGRTVNEVARRTIALGICRTASEAEAARRCSRAAAGLAILVHSLAVSISTLASH